MKKRRLKKPFKILLNIIISTIIILLLIFTLKTYNEKSDKIQKQKNDCFKNAIKDGDKIYCY